MSAANDLRGVLLGLAALWAGGCLLDAALSRWGAAPVAGAVLAALWLLSRAAAWDLRRRRA